MSNNKNTVTFIDLFCGIGSFHYSFIKNGWKCILACDISKPARKTYRANHKIKPLKDICDIDPKNIPTYDIICAGFPCFVAGTKVLTYNGYKKIEDIILEDKLLTHTGKFQSILNLQRKIYSKNLYNIKLKYHPEKIISTEEHPFFVREKKKKWNNFLRKYDYIFEEPVWKKANELTKNDYLGMIINTNISIPEFTFKQIINQHANENRKIILDDINMWFIMGYFIGDGWIEETPKNDGRQMYKIRFAINNKNESEILEKIKKILPITDKKCDTGKCKKYGCSDFIWYNILKQFGKYAHGKIIPEWIQDSPKEYIQEFINGYMKADGCINKNDVLQITTVSYNLAFGLQRLYLKLGHIFAINKCIRPKTTIIDGRTVNQRDTYCVRGKLNKEKASGFIKENYAWFPLSHIKISQTINMPVYNFEVENDNSYIVENTIVHNCQPFSQAGKHKGFDDKRGTLFFQVMKFVKFHKPKIIVLENVKALLNHDNGNTFNRIKNELTNENYDVVHEVLTCSDYGIPQMRKRLFIIGVRNDLDLNYELNNFFDITKYKKNVSLSKYLNKKFKKDIAYTIRCGGRLSPINDRHNWDGYIVNNLEYRLTLEDALKLQGFDNNFILKGTSNEKWKLLGNTIPIIFTKIIGDRINELITF